MISNIQNLIFDMGNVLIRFEPETFLDAEGVYDPKDRALLLQLIYHSQDWPKLDQGIWNETDMEAIVCSLLPERLHPAAVRLISHWDEPLLPVEGMAELIEKCKEKGYRIYLLSNASRRQHEYWPRIPGSRYFDGTVISADILHIKPDPAIYTYLLDTFGLKAEECLFIDDVEQNTKAAEALGIHTFLFRNNVQELTALILE